MPYVGKFSHGFIIFAELLTSRKLPKIYSAKKRCYYTTPLIVLHEANIHVGLGDKMTHLPVVVITKIFELPVIFIAKISDCVKISIYGIL